MDKNVSPIMSKDLRDGHYTVVVRLLFQGSCQEFVDSDLAQLFSTLCFVTALSLLFYSIVCWWFNGNHVSDKTPSKQMGKYCKLYSFKHAL